MQSTDLDAERDSSPRSLKSRKKEEQSVKLSDRLWMVKEVLTFDMQPTNLAKSYKINRTPINKWVYTYKSSRKTSSKTMLPGNATPSTEI